MTGAGNENSGQPTIFVVDDEPVLLEFAEAILAPMGFLVRTFRNAETALKEYWAVHPVLVITDYAMGHMTGMDLICACRQLDPLQKTILVSGAVNEHVFDQSPVKPDQFIAKPYQVRDFAESVRSLVTRELE